MKKRNYLYRLGIVMMTGLILPAVLAFNIFHWYAIKGWQQSNEGFYEKALNTYVTLLDKKIHELEIFAAKISAESKEADSILREGSQTLSGNAYQIYSTTKVLSEKYTRSDVREWGIYFYDIDKIITPEYSYSPEHFVYKYTGQSLNEAECADFFSMDNYSLLNTVFASTNNETRNDGCLLLGVCSRIGTTNDKVLVFYVLSPKDINDSLAIVGGEGISYYLLDQENERLLLTWGDSLEETPEDIWTASVSESTAGIKQKVLYSLQSSYPSLSVKAYISQDSLLNNILDWILNMKTMLACMVIILLITCSIAIYIAYKPMYELINELDYPGGSEFDIIRHRLGDQGLRINEQQMLILDLLINHMIYGIPISEERIKQLGITESTHYYCVFLVEGYSFINEEITQLTQKLEKEYDARIFVTDWRSENCSVMIFFSKTEDVSPVRTSLENWLSEKYGQECCLYTGTVYDQLECIKLSFQSCLEQQKKKNGKKQKAKLSAETLSPKKEQQKKMTEEILAYLETHYQDAGLSQMQVADLFQISNYTLSRLFKNQVGVGFAEYLTAKRLEYARELLLTTDASIKEVSTMAGFTSENYFSRTFKLYEGMSPSSFRNQ